MTVQNAIEILQKFPPEADMNFSWDGGMLSISNFIHTAPKNKRDPFYLCNGWVDVIVKGLNSP